MLGGAPTTPPQPAVAPHPDAADKRWFFVEPMLGVSILPQRGFSIPRPVPIVSVRSLHAPLRGVPT